MSRNSRTRQAPDDLIDVIVKLEKRVKDLETNQRLSYSAFELGSIKMISEIPSITMYPTGPDSTRRAALYAFDFGGTGDPAGTAVTLVIEGLDPDSFIDSAGGTIFLGYNFALLGVHNPIDDIPESYIWLGQPGDDLIDFQGTFNDQNQTSAQQAIYSGSFVTGAGFTSFTHTYFEAFASQVVPVCTLLNSAGALTWNLTAQSTSSFTVAWSGTLTKTINFWNVRLQ